MPILKIEKLTKKYGKTYALNGLDMEVKKGDIYGFVGPNGAGKTTMLRIISGLLKSDGGDLWLDGVRTTKNILKQKSLIGFVPDFFGVYENLSVIEYLEFFCRIVWNLRAGRNRPCAGSAGDGRTIGKRGADGGFALKGHTAAALSGARDDP